MCTHKGTCIAVSNSIVPLTTSSMEVNTVMHVLLWLHMVYSAAE